MVDDGAERRSRARGRRRPGRHDQVTVWLDGDLIGNPTSFGVGFATAAVTVELGKLIDAKQVLDGLQPFINQWP